MPTVQANADLAGSLDEFLVAVYALILARQSGFTDRLTRPIDITAVDERYTKPRAEVEATIARSL